MKKVWIGIALVLFVCLLGGFVFLNSNSQKNEEGEEVVEAYSFVYDNQTLTVGDEFKDYLIAAEYNVSEVANCAFASANQVYTYDDLEIVPATVDEKRVIYSVYFITLEVSTEEGIKLGDSLDDVLNTYGDNYEQPLTNKYVYTKGKTELSFIFDDDVVTSIEYTLLVD